MQYDAIITREGKHHLIEFPDCPGCQTFAETEKEVLATAQEALEGWLEAHLVSGRVPPRPARRTHSRVLCVPVSSRLSAALLIRWGRQDQKLTQGELARRADVSQQQIAKLEDSDGNPTLGTLERVAAALGMRTTVDFATASPVQLKPAVRKRA